MSSMFRELQNIQAVGDSSSSSAECDCAKLDIGDIPGAELTKSPTKCKVTELKIWLKCRGQTVKSRETKAELSLRVKKCMESGRNFDIVDPYPNQPHISKKKLNCNVCKDVCSGQQISDENNNEVKCDWTRETKLISKQFSYIDILEFAKRSGKNLKVKDYVEKPIERGYAFFHDGYTFDQKVAEQNGKTVIKGKCYRSMKKNESPHSVNVSLELDGKVFEGKCSCVAGASGQCNHVYALLYSIDHCIKMKETVFNRVKTCTEKPAEWSKCRTEGIRSEPVMISRVVKPKYGSKSTGIQPSLYEARAGAAKSVLDVEGCQRTLRKINPLFGICQTVNGAGNKEETKTRMGFPSPLGSPLSYQLSITEGDFSVCENIPQIRGKVTDNIDAPPPFPWSDTTVEHVPAEAVRETKLELSSETAIDIYEKTMSQSSSDLWFSVRKHRLTASKFGAILKRKKDKEKFIKTTLIGKKVLSNVPAVQFGINNEDRAVKEYVQYMSNCKRKIKVFQAGCVINPAFPWMAATPDRVVYNQDVGFGLVEVKCSYSKRNVTPVEACNDPSFFCTFIDGNLQLKRDHEYYAQVQGQLGVCGAKYCDFIVFTNKGLGIHRIPFDEKYWGNMSEKLRTFFLTDFLPVIKAQLP